MNEILLIFSIDVFFFVYILGYGLTLGFPTIVIPALKANATNSDGDFNLSNEEISWFSEFISFSRIYFDFEIF